MFPISRFFETIRMNIRANWLSRHSFQSEHWAQYLTEYDNKNPDVFGFEWGDPEDTNDRHGNYKMILDLLNNTLNEKDVVLEIGALGGKWTKYLLKAKKIIAVDVNDVFIEHINKRFPEAKNIEFYVSKGDELNGIKDDTVNLVFSMDTFTRVKKKYIKSYFREINRVLVRGGVAIIHLPNADMQVSRSRSFTALDTGDIGHLASQYFSKFDIDCSTLLHGSILVAEK